MRAPVIALLCAACGAGVPPPATPAQAPASAAPASAPAAPARPRSGVGAPSDPTVAPPIDPVAALAPVAAGPVSWLVPGQLRLELDAPAVDAPGGNRPIEVSVIERVGTLARVAIRLGHARFAAWTDAPLLAIVIDEARVETFVGHRPTADRFVALRPGARVQRLGHASGRTQVRYVGAVEVEGWIAAAALADAAPRPRANVRYASGRRTLLVTPGAILRAEPRWGGGVLATVADGPFLDRVQELPDGWVEVVYTDREVTLHGYVSRRDPPGRVHRTHDPEVPPARITPTAQVASGTCLYARRGGPPVGYLVGDQRAYLVGTEPGWWTLAIDTPWGALPFVARGPIATQLVACAPPGSVPAPAPAP